MLLLDLFVNQGKISDLDAKELEHDLANDPDIILDDTLLAKGIPSDDIAQVRSMLFGIPLWKDPIATNSDLLKYLSSAQCKKMLVAPLNFDNGVIGVGVVNPERAHVLDSLQFLFGAEHQAYKIYIISYDAWKVRFGETVVSPQTPLGAKNTGVFVEKDDTPTKPDSVKPAAQKTPVARRAANDGNGDATMIDLTSIDPLIDNAASLQVPDLFNLILRYAISKESSDIHIEHMESDMRVRCRTDGSLETVVSLPNETHPMLVARIKILSGMKLDEKRKPQDGRFSTMLDGHQIDYRVSSFPSYYGEKIVIRILDSFRGVRKIDAVGLSKRDLGKIREALAAPFGIILISGPTGSGKTTTLYAMLQEVDREHKNVVSLEDPVEYNLDSISQSQVFPEIGYTFAAGLRSILRQDPDVIMVGEIRDAETAQLAIQAALTGHLVFSTIHTNTATGVITRLLDMGIEPYLIAPTLKLAIGQRLVRRTAPGCAQPMEEELSAMVHDEFAAVPDEFKKDLPLNQPLTRAVPSEKYPNGLKGRQPVFEVLVIDDELENAIATKKSEQDLIEMAKNKGMISLRQDAVLKCIEGIIPYSEIHEL